MNDDKKKTKEQLISELKSLRQENDALKNQETEHKKGEKLLQESEQKYRSLVELTDDSIYLVDKDCRYLFMNRNHLIRLNLVGREYEKLTYGDLHSTEETRVFRQKVDRTVAANESLQFEYKSKKNKRHFFQTFSPVLDDTGGIEAIMVVSKDITRLKEMEDLQRTLYLKNINDTYGHQEGDRAIIEVARIIDENYRRSDVIARIGGDEFVILPVGDSRDTVEMISARLKKVLDSYNEKSALQYKISLSVGIAYYDPQNPCTVDELLDMADKAMYHNKKQKQQQQK
jgi:diguanylate cyclase (GGDEF)-like protein